jgi:hypothetical protein
MLENGPDAAQRLDRYHKGVDVGSIGGAVQADRQLVFGGCEHDAIDLRVPGPVPVDDVRRQLLLIVHGECGVEADKHIGLDICSLVDNGSRRTRAATGGAGRGAVASGDAAESKNEAEADKPSAIQ